MSDPKPSFSQITIVTYGGGGGGGTAHSRVWTLDPPAVSAWKFENTIDEIPASELMEGDVITHVKASGGTYRRVEALKGDCVGWLVTGEDGDYYFGVVLYEDGTQGKVSNLVLKDSENWYKVTKLKQEPQAVAGPSKWNGKCSSCGKNTYTGFLQIEHDGPCQGR